MNIAVFIDTKMILVMKKTLVALEKILCDGTLFEQNDLIIKCKWLNQYFMWLHPPSLWSRYYLILSYVKTEAAVRRCSSKWGFLKISQCAQENTCWSLFLIKLQAWRPATLLKRDSSTGFLLLILRNFKETLFSQNTFGGCFCKVL